jgi:hypothetical protein
MSLLDQAVIDSCEIGAKIELEKLRADLAERDAALLELAETHRFRMEQWANEVAKLTRERDEYRARCRAHCG